LCIIIPQKAGIVASVNKPKKKKLTFITGNAKKLEEVRQILRDDFPFDLVAKKVDLPELQGADPKDIAREKCRLAAQQVDGPCFIEDTCLSFTALNGMPGPYIKWFLEKCGHDGLNRMLDGFADKSATASTIIAFTMGNDDDTIHVFEGQTQGKIVHPRGSLDFGWDPIFEPNESDGKTYAEMEKSAKNVISHRGRSLSKFIQYISDISNHLTKMS
jgi:inosine triphosphate pyrophosphatase